MKTLIAIELNHESEERLRNERMKLEDLIKQAVESRHRYSNPPEMKIVTAEVVDAGKETWKLP